MRQRERGLTSSIAFECSPIPGACVSTFCIASAASQLSAHGRAGGWRTGRRETGEPRRSAQSLNELITSSTIRSGSYPWKARSIASRSAMAVFEMPAEAPTRRESKSSGPAGLVFIANSCVQAFRS